MLHVSCGYADVKPNTEQRALHRSHVQAGQAGTGVIPEPGDAQSSCTPAFQRSRVNGQTRPVNLPK